MEMKASTQYNDYMGTAAADFADFQTLEAYLKDKGLDTDRYKPIGVELYCGYSNFVNPRFICKDILSEEKKALTFGFENKISITEFLDLFKRFNVVLTWAKGEDYSDWEELDDDTQYIDDRK